MSTEGESGPTATSGPLSPSVPIGANEQEDNDMGLFSSKPKPGSGAASAAARASAAAGHRRVAASAMEGGRYAEASHHYKASTRLDKQQRNLNRKGR